MSAPIAAAIDIGSNTVHLLVARRDADGLPVRLLDISDQAGIGQRVDADGALGEGLRASLVGILDTQSQHARAWGAGMVVLLGTEAVRTATDAADLHADIRAGTGLTLIVLDRETEGLLTLLGVTGGKVPVSVAVVDIGGGSTEVTVAPRDRPPVVGLVPTGSARLAAAHVHHDPVTEPEVEALRRAAREHVATLGSPLARRCVVSGGSGTNVSRLLGRERTTPVDRAAIDAAFRLLRREPAATLAARTGLTVRRVSQLAAGLAIGEALLDRFGLDVLEVSDASLREGALIAAWRAGEGWLAALPAIVGAHLADGRADRAPEGRDRAS